MIKYQKIEKMLEYRKIEQVEKVWGSNPILQHLKNDISIYPFACALVPSRKISMPLRIADNVICKKPDWDNSDR